jgi:hypothetical protein
MTFAPSTLVTLGKYSADEFTQYRCPTCRRLYRRPADLNVSCTVVHGRGDCCHYMETEIQPKARRAAR